MLLDWILEIARDKKNLLSMVINCQDRQLSFDLRCTFSRTEVCVNLQEGGVVYANAFPFLLGGGDMVIENCY